MKLTGLTLYHFRNYEELHLALHPGVNLSVGENAQGKTNAVLGAVRRAMGLYHSEYRTEMLPRALKCDFSWRRSAKQYMAMYLGI